MFERSKKKLTQRGGLTIPQHLRHQIGMHCGAAVELVPQSDGALLIKPYIPCCHICGGSGDHLRTVKGIHLCFNCFEGFREEFDGFGE